VKKWFFDVMAGNPYRIIIGSASTNQIYVGFFQSKIPVKHAKILYQNYEPEGTDIHIVYDGTDGHCYVSKDKCLHQVFETIFDPKPIG